MKSTLLKKAAEQKKRTKTRWSKYKTNNKMIELTPKNQDLLNVSRFNNLIKIQRLSDLKNKTRPNYTLLTTDT